MVDMKTATHIADLLAGVGEVTRMRILHRLAGGPSSVGKLAAELGVPMVNLSHHLNVLRHLGILENVKQGRQVIYSVSPKLFTLARGSETPLGTLAVGPWTLAVRRPAAPPTPAA